MRTIIEYSNYSIKSWIKSVFFVEYNKRIYFIQFSCLFSLGKLVEFLKDIGNKVSTICKFVIEKADIFCQFIRTKMLIAYSFSNVVENACLECIFVSV